MSVFRMYHPGEISLMIPPSLRDSVEVEWGSFSYLGIGRTYYWMVFPKKME